MSKRASQGQVKRELFYIDGVHYQFGTKRRGKGGQSKPRQVFFTINEYENDDEFEAKAHMVHGKEYSAVPPPSSLQHRSIVAGSSTRGHQDRLQKHLHSQGNPDAMLELAIQAAQAEALRIEREQKVPISPLVHRPLKEAAYYLAWSEFAPGHPLHLESDRLDHQFGQRVSQILEAYQFQNMPLPLED